MMISKQGISQQLIWFYINSRIRYEFPTVTHITSQTLAQWLQHPETFPQIIDTRKPHEFAVSHLMGAQNITTVAAACAANLNRERAIVTYCSVGYRSARLAEKLQHLGFKRVLNLEGSIFQWANEGRLVMCGNQPTTAVHPYNQAWGKLLITPQCAQVLASSR